MLPHASVASSPFPAPFFAQPAPLRQNQRLSAGWAKRHGIFVHPAPFPCIASSTKATVHLGIPDLGPNSPSHCGPRKPAAKPALYHQPPAVNPAPLRQNQRLFGKTALGKPLEIPLYPPPSAKHAFIQEKISLYRNTVLLHGKSLLLHRKGMLVHKESMIPQRGSMLLHRQSMLLHGGSLLLHKGIMSSPRKSMLLRRKSNCLPRNSIPLVDWSGVSGVLVRRRGRVVARFLTAGKLLQCGTSADLRQTSA